MNPVEARYVSLRWRILMPVFGVLLVGSMVCAYVLSGLLSVGGTAAATDVQRQIAGVLLAALAAAVVIVVFVLASQAAARAAVVAQTARSLAAGEMMARTGMQASDEIGAAGQALDSYADRVQERHDLLRDDLRRQRRRVTHLTAVLEALPEGVIVQDRDGSVILMNERARTMLGAHRVRDDDAQALTAFAADALGPALAPGLYALGTPHQIALDGRVLRAQAAAIISAGDRRVGTVIALNDITDDIRRDQLRELLLEQAERDVQEPLLELANRARPAQETAFNRELRRHAADLQKLVLELRELNALSLQQLAERGQRPINLDTLVWSVANEWRQVAQANNLTLHVVIGHGGMHVLGNEHRLRWAIGNLVDNAIKYTPPGGDFIIEIRGETPDGKAHLRIRDNGVGIAPEELPHVFVRFYRGSPVAQSGRPLRVPGTGQGLSTARQIIEAHGGQIGVQSRPHVGTAVDFTLPLTAPVSLELPNLHTADPDGETVRIYAARADEQFD